jgi:CheY-like chemotaxis protein
MAEMKSLRVLLVEDDVVTRQQTETRLSLLGYEVFPCSSGESALDACRHGQIFDLILMDLRSGEAEAVFMIRALPESGDVPILVAAADAEAGPTRGADHVIQRPYHLHELVRAIGETVDRRAAR